LSKKRARLQKLSPVEQSLLAEAQRLFDAGQLSEARQRCEQLINTKPRAPEPLLLKAWVHVQENDFFAAQNAVRQAALLLPTDAGVQAWAAEVCSAAGDLQAAEKYQFQTTRLHSKDPAVLRSLAASLTNGERYQEALTYYQRLLKRVPGDANVRLNVAYAARFAGEMDIAREALLKLLEENPAFYQAQFALSQLRTADPEHNHIEWFEKSLAAGGEDTQAKGFLGYALGKEYEDLGEYDRAFHYYSLGAAAQNQAHRRAGADAGMIARLQEHFSDLPTPTDGDLGRGMVFIVGLPRTGTTLLDRILGAHSQIENSGELLAFPFSVHRCLGLKVRGVMTTDLLSSLGALQDEELGKAYLACLPDRLRQRSFLTDKNPINFLYAGLIAKALPGASIINMQRNPMDSCFSNFKQLFAPGAYLHSYDLAEMAGYYSAYSSLMGLWKAALGDRYIEVFYEDLVSDSEAEVRRLLRVLGLDWEDAILDFHRRESSVGSASFAQVRQPVYSSSVAKWRHFKPYLHPLREALVKAGISESALGE
jgi:tetratricopeptide (TPR) repeat protein